MKKILTLLCILVTSICFSQAITPPIPTTGNANAVLVPTVVSETTTHNAEIKLHNTLTINYGVDFTINGNVTNNGGGNGKIILLGNNRLIINGNVNGGVYFEMNGNVCIYASGVFNAGNSLITSNGTGNYISTGGNINNIGNIPSTVCASGNTSNPCAVDFSNINMPCNNQCSSDPNNIATWNGTSWTNNGNNTSVNNGKSAIVNSDYSGPSFACCSLKINAGNTLTINSGVTVTVVNGITNNGNIVIESGGSLVQVNNSSTTMGNVITVKRNTQPVYRYDFTYWSSPVKDYSLHSLSPLTLRDKYNSFDENTQRWITHLDGASNMIAGKGYMVRAPQTYPIEGSVGAVPSIYNAEFIGKPNNGIININVAGGTDKFNLLGNPYPSALNVSKFLLDNNTKLQGTVYLWTHNTAVSQNNPGGQTYNYSPSDYAAFNLSGGVSTAPALSGGNPGSINNMTPSGFIASGQGFFVEGISNGNATFNNSMRVAGNNNQFFRMQSNASEEGEKNRFWLNLTNTENNKFNQILIGYIENATNSMDWGYDGKLFSTSTLTLYSILDDNKLTIQGRALPFSNQDVVPLGYTSLTAGNLKISIESLDGFMTYQDIYLKDKLLNVMTNLKVNDYTFNTTAGTFNERFEIRYVNDVLGVDVPTLSNVSMTIKNNHLLVKSKEVINNIVVYDILGKIIHSGKYISDYADIYLDSSTQVVVVSVTTNSGNIKKKMINQ